jgi:hypothetical protein
VHGSSGSRSAQATGERLQILGWLAFAAHNLYVTQTALHDLLARVHDALGQRDSAQVHQARARRGP